MNSEERRVYGQVEFFVRYSYTATLKGNSFESWFTFTREDYFPDHSDYPIDIGEVLNEVASYLYGQQDPAGYVDILSCNKV